MATHSSILAWRISWMEEPGRLQLTGLQEYQHPRERIVFFRLLLFFFLKYVRAHSVISDSFATPCTAALRAPFSMGFSRQEYWSRLPFTSPGDHPDPGIEPWSYPLQAISCIAGGFFTD